MSTETLKTLEYKVSADPSELEAELKVAEEKIAELEKKIVEQAETFEKAAQKTKASETTKLKVLQQMEEASTQLVGTETQRRLAAVDKQYQALRERAAKYGIDSTKLEQDIAQRKHAILQEMSNRTLKESLKQQEALKGVGTAALATEKKALTLKDGARDLGRVMATAGAQSGQLGGALGLLGAGLGPVAVAAAAVAFAFKEISKAIEESRARAKVAMETYEQLVDSTALAVAKLEDARHGTDRARFEAMEQEIEAAEKKVREAKSESARAEAQAALDQLHRDQALKESLLEIAEAEKATMAASAERAQSALDDMKFWHEINVKEKARAAAIRETEAAARAAAEAERARQVAEAAAKAIADAAAVRRIHEDLERSLLDLTGTATQKQLAALGDRYVGLLAQAAEFGVNTKALEQALQDERAKILTASVEKQVEAVEEVEQAYVSLEEVGRRSFETLTSSVADTTRGINAMAEAIERGWTKMKVNDGRGMNLSGFSLLPGGTTSIDPFAAIQAASAGPAAAPSVRVNVNNRGAKVNDPMVTVAPDGGVDVDLDISSSVAADIHRGGATARALESRYGLVRQGGN